MTARSYFFKPGMIIGNFTIVEKTTHNNRARYSIKCNLCGNRKTLPPEKIVRDKSCGCRRKIFIGIGNRKHGRSGTPEDNVFRGMKARCFNKNLPSYKYYGGRGITICQRWLKGGVAVFVRDMGPRPPGLTLERKNTNKGYSPSNCKWATRKEQRINQRRVRRFLIGGRLLTSLDIMAIAGITHAHLDSRLRHKWRVEDLILPKGTRRPHLPWRTGRPKKPKAK